MGVAPATEKHNLIQSAKDDWGEKSPRLKESAEPAMKTEAEDKEAEKAVLRLGEEFCHWFFELLNSQNPFLGSPQDEWGPQHF